MDKIEWSDAYLIGIESLDYQHKKLFDLVNLFFETAETSKFQNLVGPVLSGLLAYTKSHFVLEEAVMQEAGYPEFATHQAQHQWLRLQVEKASNRLNNNQTIDRAALANFLKEWLTEHIASEDKKIGCYIKRNPLCTTKHVAPLLKGSQQ